jgi:hypothetical protein
MFSDISRRRFVTAAAGTALAGLGDFSFLDSLPRLEGASGPVLPGKVQVSSDIEPLVRLIEDTPRNNLLEKVADRIRSGASYQELLSALFLAGVRGIQPRPVGYKFHAVLVINSAHLASLAAVDQDRWLPLIWSLDNYKRSQQENKEKGNWHMAPVAESKLPAPHKAKKAFTLAMDNWDEAAADAAVTALARSEGAMGVWEMLWPYGARDFRDIGHKAIYTANAWRTLQAIGWRHAEPVLRSLAYALLDRSGTKEPHKENAPADLPGRANLPRAMKFALLLNSGKRNAAASKDVLATLRTASPEEASKKVLELLQKGIHPESVWDGLFMSAGELLMKAPPALHIIGLHCLTSTNALHYGYETTGRGNTRTFLTLQAAAFLTMFRQTMNDRSRGKLPEVKLDELEKAELKKGGVAEVLADVSRNRMQAARETLALLERDPRQAEPLMSAARRLIFAKGTDSHDYKFSSAVLEDYYALAPSLRPRYLAASMFNLKGSGDRDNGLIKRARAALAKS